MTKAEMLEPLQADPSPLKACQKEQERLRSKDLEVGADLEREHVPRCQKP